MSKLQEKDEIKAEHNKKGTHLSCIKMQTKKKPMKLMMMNIQICV